MLCACLVSGAMLPVRVQGSCAGNTVTMLLTLAGTAFQSLVLLSYPLSGKVLRGIVGLVIVFPPAPPRGSPCRHC